MIDSGLQILPNKQEPRVKPPDLNNLFAFCLVTATRRRALVATFSIIAAVLVIGGAVLWRRKRRQSINGDNESNVFTKQLNKLYIKERLYLISSINNNSLSCRP